MKLKLSALVALACVATSWNQAVALAPAAAPFTLWNFLGIPQGLNKIRDASSNRFGNRPGMERKPPLKALADPANLLSPNPAIAKAAEIKAQEDLAPQKIKAIKYLATIGCGCYPGVKDAIAAALDDCTEEVRYQSVLAIQDASTQHCNACNKNCCCDQELTLKLSQVAYEKNDKGLWLEESERVREAAKVAMRMCCPGTGPIGADTVPTEPGREDAIEGAPTPLPPVAPDEAPSAQRGLGANPISSKMARGGSKVMLPQSVSPTEQGAETEEIVTIDFGNQPGQPSSTVSSRRTTTPTRKPPAGAPKKSSASVPTGTSSRRAAVERGLATQPVSASQPAPKTALRPVPAPKKSAPQQPNTISKWLWGSPDKNQASKAAYQTAVSTPSAPKSEAQASPAPASSPVDGKTSEQPVDGTRKQAVEGTVSRISLESGTVEVRVARGSDLRVGDRLKVSHDYLLSGAAVGQLEIVVAGPRVVTARPVDGLTLDKIARGDAATFEPAAKVSRSSSAKVPAVSPALASDGVVRR